MTEAIKRTLRDSAPMRWLVLVMVSALMFATYWFQDFYSGLKPLMESQLGITSSQFGQMIGLTTIANIFGMIIVGGIVLDKWGIRLTAIIFGTVAALGGIISALGAHGIFSQEPSTRLVYMIIGRIIFGIGLETTCVLITRTIVKWFKGYELALAMAVNMGIGRLGSAMGTALSPEIANFNAPTAITFAAFLISLGFVLFMIYLIFDVRIDKQTSGEKPEAGDEEKFKMSDLLKLATDRSFIFIALLCVAFYSAVFPFMQYAPDLLVNKFGFSYDLPKGAELTLFGSSSLGNVSIFVVFFLFGTLFPILPGYIKSPAGKKISLIALIFLFVLFIYSVKNILSIWLVNGPKAASLLPLATIFFTPIFGRMVDKKGKAASIMMLGAVLLIFAHLSLSLFSSHLLCYAGLLSLGIAFSLVPAAMWPSVAKIVPEYRLGTAYASMFTVQNWGLGLFFWGIGKFLDFVNPDVVTKMREIRQTLESQGFTGSALGEKIESLRINGELPIYNYTWPIFMLVGLGVISIFLAYMLKKSSDKQGYGLDLPSNAK